MNRNRTLSKQQGRNLPVTSWSGGLSLSQKCTMRPMNCLAAIWSLTQCQTGHRSHSLSLFKSQELNPLSDKIKLFIKFSRVLLFSSLKVNCPSSAIPLLQWCPFGFPSTACGWFSSWLFLIFPSRFCSFVLGIPQPRKETIPPDP